MQKWMGLLLVSTLMSGWARAGVIDSDHAGNGAYQDGWQHGDDGSVEISSLGGWIMGTGAQEPKVAVESSISLGAGQTDIDRDGKAFKMHDPAQGYMDVFRFIEPLGLETGETFSLDLAVNFRAGYKGLDVRDRAENTLFNFNIGEDDYAVSQAASQNGSIGSAYAAHTVFHLSFRQDSDAGGTWTITRHGGVNSTTTGAYSGRICSMKLYAGQQGPDPEDALYFNNFQISSDQNQEPRP